MSRPASRCWRRAGPRSSGSMTGASATRSKKTPAAPRPPCRSRALLTRSRALSECAEIHGVNGGITIRSDAEGGGARRATMLILACMRRDLPPNPSLRSGSGVSRWPWETKTFPGLADRAGDYLLSPIVDGDINNLDIESLIEIVLRKIYQDAGGRFMLPSREGTRSQREEEGRPRISRRPEEVAGEADCRGAQAQYRQMLRRRQGRSKFRPTDREACSTLRGTRRRV